MLGLRDYVRKNGFRSVVARRSPAVSTPPWSRRSRWTRWAPTTSSASRCRAGTRPSTRRDDAADLASRTGLDYRVEPIQPIVDAYLDQLKLDGLALENLQARVRGVILMALSNQEGHLVLTTGNKSELAVGYSTLYGDSVGGYNPIKDVWKTRVWQLARWRNAAAERARRDAADPGTLDHQAAQRRAATRPARHRLAARLRPASTRC